MWTGEGDESGGNEVQPKDLTTIRDLVAAKLPRAYEPLLLTFYGHEAREAGDDVIIGDDYGTELHLTADGTVISIDPEGQLPSRFVNSSVAQLAQFLEVVSRTERSDDQREMWRMLADLDTPRSRTKKTGGRSCWSKPAWTPAGHAVVRAPDNQPPRWTAWVSRSLWFDGCPFACSGRWTSIV